MPDRRSFTHDSIPFHEKIKLEEDLLKKDQRIKELETDNQRIENLSRQKLEHDQQLLADKDSEIKRLQAQVESMAEKENLDLTLIKELSTANILKDTYLKQYEEQLGQVIVLQNDVNYYKNQLDFANQNYENISALYKGLQVDYGDLLLEFEQINKNIQASFNTADLSKYLTKAINSFNESVNTENQEVTYIINEMDVEMKAHVGKTGDDQMIMASPNFASNKDEALSSIKFSIRAIPKNMASDV